MKHRMYHLAVIVLGGLLVLTTACGGDDPQANQNEDQANQNQEETNQSEENQTNQGEENQTNQGEENQTNGDEGPLSAETEAAELHATLTAGLQEHVYLAGIAISAAVDAGGDMDDETVEAAVATLDTNSVALADAVGSVYGSDAEDAFLTMWREHIGFFVEYTLGVATGDDTRADDALADLDAYGTSFGNFIDSATDGELDSSTVEANLEAHVDTVVAAIDATVAGDNDRFDKLAEAARHMSSTAAALASAINAQFPEDF